MIHRNITLAQEGSPTFLNVPAGPRTGTCGSPVISIRKGDAAWMDGGCHIKHYHSEYGTCVMLGDQRRGCGKSMPPSKKGERGTRSNQARGKMAKVDTMQDAVRRAGIDRPFAFGHGIGIEERDHPILQDPFAPFDDGLLRGTNDIALETGMVVNIEVNRFEFGVGGLKSEWTLVVTPIGSELITPQKRQMNIVVD